MANKINNDNDDNHNDDNHNETIDMNFLKKSLNKRCLHRIRLRGGDINNRTGPICIDIGNIIRNGIENNIKFDCKLLDKYLSKILQRQNRFMRCCYNLDSVELNPIIHKILSVHIPSISIMKKIIGLPNYIQFLVIIANNNPNFSGFDYRIVKKLLDDNFIYVVHCNDDNNTNNINNINNTINKQLFELIKNKETNNDILATLFLSRSKIVQEWLYKLIKTKPELIKEEHLYNSIKSYPESTKVINEIIKLGFNIDSICLEIACECCSLETIEYVINYRIKVTRIHFEKLIQSTEIIIKRSGNSFKIKKINGYSKDKMNLLFLYGYEPTYDDIKFSIKNKVELPNLDRFKIRLDTIIANYCHQYNFYPNYDFEKTDEKLYELQSLCNKKKLNKIKNYIEKQNIGPDQMCIKNACGIKNNFEMINYLIDQGCYIDDDCYMQVCKANVHVPVKHTKLLDKINENHEVYLKTQKNKYVDKIQELINIIKKYDNSFSDEFGK